MIVEVLLSVMNQNDMRIVDRCNVHSNCIVVNQCEREETHSEVRDYGRVMMVSTKERGLSRSRNMALDYSTADICVLCDDDIVYVNDYEKTIERAFEELPDADIIVFNIHSMNTDIRPQEKVFDRIKKVPKYKMYSSVHIAFRRESIIKNNLRFDTKFGAGSGIYSMAEDSIFFASAHKAGMNIYCYPAVIADLYSEQSTWFQGYNERYFYDVGAFLQVTFPKLKYVFCFYYPLRFRNLTDMNPLLCLMWICKGMSGYKKGLSYVDFIS